MRLLKAFALTVAAFGVAATASAEVRVSLQDGRVTIVAKDATLRQILEEWARVGQTTIVNGERLPGGPVTVQFNNAPEDVALASLLRPLTGYIAAPREETVTNLSRFDRILVLPTVAPTLAPAVASGPQPAVFPQPGMPFNPNVPQQIPGMTDDQDDDRPNANRQPVFNTFPQPQVAGPQPQMYPAATPGVMPPNTGPAPLAMPQPYAPAPNAPVNGAYPGAPTAPYPGVATPGMMPPAQPQPGMPLQPGQQPPKRPGPGGE